jgi:phosphate transport system substrate-binding protein
MGIEFGYCMNSKTTILLLILISVFICSCARRPAIKISGSTTVLPVVSNAAEQFLAMNSGLNIIVHAGGSGVGINQLGEGKVDVGMISRNLTDLEIERYPDVEFVTHTIGRDAVVPVVSSEIYDFGVRALSLKTIGRIYKGEIRNWKEIGGPDKNILVIDKERARGTRHVFMEKVLGDKEAVAEGADLVLGSNNEEQTAIVQSDAAIGMLSNAWLNEDVKAVSIIVSDNVVIAATHDNFVKGRFPMTRDLLLVTNGQPRGIVKDFIEFIFSDYGQEIVEAAGYVKAP